MTLPGEPDGEFMARVADFAGGLACGTTDRDRDQSFDRDLWGKCGEFGMLGLPVPELYGGSGKGALDTVGAMEAFGSVCDDNGLAFAMGAQLWACMIPVLEFGTGEQRSQYLPKLSSGQWIAAHAASEVGAGSDIFALETRAHRKGDHFVIEGAKTFVTNAPVCDMLVVFANENPERGSSGISAFVVERDNPGVTVTGPISKMGMRTAMMGEIVFDRCEVPASARLGEEGAGISIFMTAMEWERAFIMAPAVGGMDRLLRRTVTRARERSQFGKRIGEFQAVSHRIAEMRRALETSRSLLYRVATAKDAGRRLGADGALVKLHLSESWIEVSTSALQLHGALGYLSESGLEREVRDALGSRIYSGTSELQREVIARYLGT